MVLMLNHLFGNYEKLEENEVGSWTVKCIHCGCAYYHSHNTETASIRGMLSVVMETKTRIVNSKELIPSYYFVYLNMNY